MVKRGRYTIEGADFYFHQREIKRDGWRFSATVTHRDAFNDYTWGVTDLATTRHKGGYASTHKEAWAAVNTYINSKVEA